MLLLAADNNLSTVGASKYKTESKQGAETRSM